MGGRVRRLRGAHRHRPCAFHLPVAHADGAHHPHHALRTLKLAFRVDEKIRAGDDSLACRKASTNLDVLVDAIAKASKEATFARLLAALGIPNVGSVMARPIAEKGPNLVERVRLHLTAARRGPPAALALAWMQGPARRARPLDDR